METSVQIGDLKVDLEMEQPFCRCCLSTENRMLDATKVGHYFKDLANIDVVSSDGLPSWICHECEALLRKAVMFKQKMLRVQTMLCDYITRCSPFPIEADDPELARLASPQLCATRTLAFDTEKAELGFHKVLQHNKQDEKSALRPLCLVEDVQGAVEVKMEQVDLGTDYEDDMPLDQISNVALSVKRRRSTLEVTGEKKKKVVVKTPEVSVKTPEISVRPRPRTPSPPHSPSLLASCAVDRVEDIDLTDCEEEGDETLNRVSWWVGQGSSSPEHRTLSTAAEENLRNSKDASFHSTKTSIKPRRVPKASSAAADVRPSCSRMTTTSKGVAKSAVNPGSDVDSDSEDDSAPLHINTQIDIPNDEELDESDRVIITSVLSAIDEDADRLLGVSNNFEWEEGFATFRGVPEEFSGPAPGPIKDYDTPYDAFTDIWSNDIIERIARETNKYAKQTIRKMKTNQSMKPFSRLHRWTETNADEIMVLLAVIMFMGIDPRTSLVEYWKPVSYLSLHKFSKLMSNDRYILLNKFLHFVDNFDVVQDCPQTVDTTLSARLAKLAPVISHLNRKFTSLYNMQREISIDESLTLFKGRLSWVQAIRTKAARFGIKSYELCESNTGYMAKFQIYTGKNSEFNAGVAPSAGLGGKPTQVVLELLQGLENLGYSVTMDNFYNSPALARYLKNSLGFDCLGTLRANCKNVPHEIAKAPKYAEKGSIIARHSGDVSVLAWKDSKWVNMISTYHDDATYVGSKAGRPLVKPVVVRDYNNTMGGVDLKDQKLAMYLLERKRCVKWYIKMFKRFLNVSIHNAFIMFSSSLKRQHRRPVSHREFRYMLADSVANRHRRDIVEEISEPLGQETRLSRQVVHSPEYVRGASKNRCCKIHQRLDIRKNVHTKCKTCDTFLCFGDCWDEWHSARKLRGREVRQRKRKGT